LVLVIIQADQLAITRRRGEAFVGFTEGAVRFAPTYKLDPGTDIYARGGLAFAWSPPQVIHFKFRVL